MGHFLTLLQGIVTQPDAAISTLPLMTEEELKQMLVEWNDTAAPYPTGVLIHELFEFPGPQDP